MVDLSFLPTPQGSNSRTWTRPPLDDSLTFPELFEFHAKHSPEHPVRTYSDEKKNIHPICYPEAFRAIRKAAKIESPVLGILAAADSITYATLVIGMMYAGYAPFPISTRNSVTFHTSTGSS
ncbi:hypothetical protein CERSUDRAFT_94732 [Gelatoporia subvermispora B]|uniref:AMP-dependent synthetase/ligase domain-containing protein n=1 Tax=Ceriporiopsis subvermispora (strain B) TaxID=914234 RepID=M2RGX5_CERS8|nr:hypothetical protein CERSUDRAFT_94732 [Gelatoporia subvermispora B]